MKKKKQYIKRKEATDICHCGCGQISLFRVWGYARNMKNINITIEKY